MTPLRARAHAKINLGLKILGRRPDGYHELRTIFQTLALHDTVEIELGPGRGVRLEMTGECAGISRDGDNLACRAAEALELKRQVVIRLRKRIPSGAGLGGGSSDAAAVLRLLGGRMSPEERLRLARQLGADVPFFLWGGTALGLGRGDEIYALPPLAPWHCVLALPATARVSTAEAFAAWDRAAFQGAGASAALTPGRVSDTMSFCSLVEQVYPAFRALPRNRGAQRKKSAPKVQAGIENDFQPGVFSLSPDFPRIHRLLRRSSPAWASLTGSGAAQFALFASADRAAACAASLPRGVRSWVTRFVGRRPMAGHMPLEHGI